MNAVSRQGIVAKNGRTIQATFFHADHAAKATVLIVPAMGVNQSYYAPLATWLAAQGYVVATFDYFGTGLSVSGNVRNADVDIIDWARFDCDAMINATTSHAPSKPLYWLGHSLGGQVLGFVPDQTRITKVVTIATGSGYWRENTPGIKSRAWWLWFVVAPLAVRLFGYFPGKRLRKVGDLPHGVMTQWRRWCLNPEYVVGAEGQAVRESFAAVTTPITSLSFTDDEMMSDRNITSLHEFYVGAPKSMMRITPQAVSAVRIGHFGFFNKRFESTLWKYYLLPELSRSSEQMVGGSSAKPDKGPSCQG